MVDDKTALATRPRLFIEKYLPVAELGIESVRESTPIPNQFPKLKTLHVWWARRPLVASSAAVLAGLLPAWNPDLAQRFDDRSELATEDTYRKWFLELCGIWGDPIAADRSMRAAKAGGYRIPNQYTYKQAFKNTAAPQQVTLLHDILQESWGCLPTVLDPTAGGGSIPFAAARLRFPTNANDLNPIAVAVLRASIELPSRYGDQLFSDLELWSEKIVARLSSRLTQFFPAVEGKRPATYIFARTVTCPRTNKTIPLVGDWSLRRGSDAVAIRLLTHRDGQELDEPEFEIAERGDIDFDPKRDATWSGGKAVSPWDGLIVDSAYIMGEAQAGRMGEILYAVAVRRPRGYDFRAPTAVDLAALKLADAELERLTLGWERDGVLPIERVPEGNKTREPRNYGMERWRDLFTSRQLLVHGYFVEEFRHLIPEVRGAIADRDRADALLALLAMMQAKALNWNARLASWDASRKKIRSVFDQHNFAFKNTFAEFEAGMELFAWTRTQLLDAYDELARLLAGEADTQGPLPHDLPAPNVSVTCANAGNLAHLPTRSQTLICIDPPYYNNVMYAELADFFYVWEKLTLGALWPDLFASEFTNKRDEAVANQQRFAQAGRRAGELADGDYTAKMAAIFAECRRVLIDDGVMVVMFTHKRSEAWDSLGAALLQAGFSVGTSWPVRTESEQSLHQARQNSAASTILLTCRPRSARRAGEGRVYLDDIDADIRLAAGEALERSYAQGLSGVDLLLSTYGPALSVLSGHWPVHAADAAADGTSRLLRPEEALDVARAEVVRRQRARLVGREAEFDAVTDFTVLAWSTFGARKFPFDEARRLALAIGGLEIEELTRRRVVTARSGMVELLEPKARLRRGAREDTGGVDLERIEFGVLIDAVHTALYIVDEDGPAMAKRWLDARDLSGNQRFAGCLQALVSAVPRSKTKGAWNVAEAELLDRLITASFPEIDIPGEEEPAETVEQQVFAVDA